MPTSPSDTASRFAIFRNSDDRPAVAVRFEDDDVWLTQAQLAAVFQTTKQLVSHHLKNIFETGELSRDRTVKKYLTVRSEFEIYRARELRQLESDFDRMMKDFEKMRSSVPAPHP